MTLTSLAIDERSTNGCWNLFTLSLGACSAPVRTSTQRPGDSFRLPLAMLQVWPEGADTTSTLRRHLGPSDSEAD
ncbi:hypothetical protein SMG44B_20221 [Stenotrophomonas maltophilia]